MAKRKKLIIAIDGPAGAGKSTIGKLIASNLGYVYVDTGALYRAIGYLAIENKIDMSSEKALTELALHTTLAYEQTKGGTRLIANGEDVTGKIRTQEVSLAASKVSSYEGVRKSLLDIQRDIGKNGGIVIDGRDIGTVIFPDAEVKFFLDANSAERANRRYKEQISRGEKVDAKRVLEEMNKRDRDDSSRECAPLKIADDAIYIDTTGKNVTEVLAETLNYIEKQLSELSN